MVACLSISVFRGSVYYSGDTGRLSVLRLYGKMEICEKNRTNEQDVREMFFYALLVYEYFYV